MIWHCFCHPISNRNGTWTRLLWTTPFLFSAKTSCARSLPTSFSYIDCCIATRQILLLICHPFLNRCFWNASNCWGKSSRNCNIPLQHPIADSYNLIVSLLYYLLLVINREYASVYHLPVDIPKNNYAYQFKDLLERHIYDVQRVAEYAEMMHVSRITLNNAVVAQFGVSANHLLKQRLLEALKNDLLFTDCTVTQLADKFSDAFLQAADR